MSTTVITVYNQEGCRRYLLPATDNADYSIVLYEKWFWLEEDLTVHLECIQGSWNLWPEPSYRIYAYSGRPDIGDLRRMIIMKEILDKPVSLRRKTGAAR